MKNTIGEKTHSFHSGAVMSTVGIGPKLFIGFEMYKPGQDSVSKDEGELNVAKRLISSVLKNHKKLIDVVVYDALACNSVWINHCRSLGIDTIVRAKNNNNNNSLRLAKRKVNKSEAVEVWECEKSGMSLLRKVITCIFNIIAVLNFSVDILALNESPFEIEKEYIDSLRVV
ncbi:MAG: hypothetical protein P4L59_10785 [Desulfosporosinus sp.]|nr:hypothetical protein [Desulfosporosinus sp.]